MASTNGSSDNSSQNAPASAQTVTIPPLTVEEEDAIIHTRITNDERPLRRVLKKFHNYTALAHTPIVPTLSSPPLDSTIEDAREAFLLELASFHLTLKKSAMICEAEARQVEEYQRERQRIEDEHGKLRGQIEQLKTALEHAQMVRRRKIEYDLVAEKVNTLPSREELESSIDSLENDMAAIRTEHDTQNRTIQGQKAAFDNIVSDLGSLRLSGKDRDNATSGMASPATTPAPDITVDTSDLMAENENGSGGSVAPTVTTHDGDADEKEEGEEDKASSDDIPLSAGLNPATRVSLLPSKSSTPMLNSGSGSTPKRKPIEEDDIEMGEVEENPKVFKVKRKVKEELEEGEASDSSSALSEPPDDI